MSATGANCLRADYTWTCRRGATMCFNFQPSQSIISVTLNLMVRDIYGT